MADSKSALKRHRQSEKRNLRNRISKATVRTHIKKTLAAIEAGDLEGAKKAFRLATQHLDKAAKNRAIHPNEASRRKSRIAKKIDTIKR